MYKSFFKSFFDIITAFLGLLFLSPIFVFVTVGLFFANQGKPFFTQLRPGLHGSIFKILKFKTMNDKTDAVGNLLPDGKRLTRIGKWIRKTSLDEIPQLLNVLIGDMSIVGPRPLLPEYMALYTPEQAKRHKVKPGITGWAQVNGRNAISWKEKFKLDVWYVANQSLLVDTKILIKTVKKVVVSEGITDAVNATTTPFKGNTYE